MKRRALVLLALACGMSAPLAAEARGRRPERAYANPSAVIGAEIAFNQLAQEKGQWTAFRETAAKEAVMFVPQTVNAREWLKGRANPPVSVNWQPHQVWTSCDGSVGVTRGAWQGPRGTGYFTTVWKRQKDGGFRWVLDQGDDLAEPLGAPDMIAATVADCTPVRGADLPASSPDRVTTAGKSDDSSLQWSATVSPDGARVTRVLLWKNGTLTTVIESRVAAPRG